MSIQSSNESFSVEDSVDNEVALISPSGTPWFTSILIIANAGLGAGLLAFPQAYNLAGGIPIAATMQFVLGVISLGSLVILAYCADQTQASSYQDVVKHCSGQLLNIICSCIIAIYTFGCSITFLIIIGDQWDKVFDYAFENPIQRNKWYLSRKFIITTTSVLFILPFCLVKRIDFLRYASGVGVTGVLYIAALVVAEYFTDLPPPGVIKLKPDHWSDIFNVLPVICFGYQCHVSSVPIYSCMKGRPNLYLFTLAGSTSTLLCFLIYLATGVLGYLSFGSKVNADILLDYPAKPEILVGLVLLAIKTYTTYPILQYCGRIGLESCILEVTKYPSSQWMKFERLWRFGCTFIWFTTSLLLALFVPDIGIVIGVLGCLASLFIFVFPGLCLLSVVSKERRPVRLPIIQFKLALACFYILLGTFIFGLTLTQSIMNLVVRLRFQNLTVYYSHWLTKFSMVLSSRNLL